MFSTLFYRSSFLLVFIILIVKESSLATEPFDVQFADNSISEIVINKDPSGQLIIFYRSGLTGETYIQKLNNSGSSIFHYRVPIPGGYTVLNVFSDGDEVRFHAIKKESKQLFIDLFIMGEEQNRNYNMIPIPKSEKLLNIMQRGDHTLVFTKENYTNIIHIYRFDKEKLTKRENIEIESKVIVGGIDRYGLQDMSTDFNPMPIASANSPCKMYYSDDEITITLDGYIQRKGEFAHHLEKINIESNTHILRTKRVPYGRNAHMIASAVVKDYVYLFTYSKHESYIEVYDIPTEKDLGDFRLAPDIELFDMPTNNYIKAYPKSYIQIRNFNLPDKKAYRELFKGNPRIAVTALDNGSIQMILGSFSGSTGKLLAPDAGNPLSMLVSMAVFAASSAVRSSSSYNGVETYICINLKDNRLFSKEFAKSTTILEQANKLYYDYKMQNKKGNGYLIHTNNQGYLMLKNKNEPMSTMYSL